MRDDPSRAMRCAAWALCALKLCGQRENPRRPNCDMRAGRVWAGQAQASARVASKVRKMIACQVGITHWQDQALQASRQQGSSVLLSGAGGARVRVRVRARARARARACACACRM